MRKNWRISAGWRGDEAPSTVAVEPFDGGQRGPQLVAHHGQELGPRPLQLLQRRQVLQGDDHRFDRPVRGTQRRGVDQHLHVPAVRHREHHLLGANRLGAVVELLHQRQLGERDLASIRTVAGNDAQQLFQGAARREQAGDDSPYLPIERHRCAGPRLEDRHAHRRGLDEGLEVRPGAALVLVRAGVGDGRRRLRGEQHEDLFVLAGELLSAVLVAEEEVADVRAPVAHRGSTHSGAAAIPALLTAGADLNMRDEDGNTPLHLAGSYVNQNERHAGDAIAALLDAGADPTVRNAAGETPWDRARDNDALRQSDGYWRLNDARFEEPREDSSRRPPSDLPRGPAAAPPAPRRTGGPTCEIPGYPSPTDVQGLGLSWCGSNVGFQRRAFALQAAGAWCDIDIGSSSTAEQVRARHQEINAACDALDALAAGGGPSCRCPAGYRP